MEEGKLTLCLTEDPKATKANRPKGFKADEGHVLVTMVRAKK